MKFLTNPWLLAGGLLDLTGLALVIWAMPEGGWPLAAGVGCLLAGAFAISQANLGLETEPAASASRGGTRRIEPELAAAPPRRVELKVRPKLVVALWAIALALMAFFFYDRVWNRLPSVASQTLLAEQGLEARGTVHRKEMRENSMGQPKYYLYYNFTDQSGSEVRSSISVPKALYDRFHENDSVQVKYIPGDALAHYLPEITRPPFALRGSMMGAVLAIFAVVVLDTQRRRHRRLVSRGVAVSGTVQDLRKRGASRTYRAAYAAAGQQLSVRTTERNPQRSAGDAVTVLYDSGNPAEAVVYPAAMYRVR